MHPASPGSRAGAWMVAAALAACGTDETPLAVTTPDGADARVAVSGVAAGLRLTNTGTSALAYLVFERNFAALALFAPCTDPGPSCVRLAPGQTVTVPFREIGGYTSAAREVIVYTWHVLPAPGGGYRAADFSSVVVRL